MNIEPWVLYSVIFTAVVLIVHSGYLYLFREIKPRRRINKRLADIALGAYRPDQVADALKRGVVGLPTFLSGLETLITQAGLKDAGHKLTLSFVLAYAVLFIISFVFVPFGVAIATAFLFNALLFYLLLVRRRGKRIARFAEQLPDVIDVIVRSLKAGHPFTVSLGLVAKEMPDPSGSEFGLVSDEITYGRDVRGALDSLYERVGYTDLRFFNTSVAVQMQTGGNLGEILSRLSKLMRDRFKMQRKIRALTSEGRFSAIVLTLFPFFLFGMMNLLAPQLYASVWGMPAVNTALAIGLLLLAIGNLIMWRMVNFRV
jgi:tight adherence protein B